MTKTIDDLKKLQAQLIDMRREEILKVRDAQDHDRLESARQLQLAIDALGSVIKDTIPGGVLNPTIRIFYQRDGGRIEHEPGDYDLAHFGGVMPAPGDLILDRFFKTGSKDRRDHHNRQMWRVVRRVFNVLDQDVLDQEGKLIGLVVEPRDVEDDQINLIG